MRIGVGTPAQATGSSGASGVIAIVSSDTWLAATPDGHQAPRIVTEWSWDRSSTVLHLKLRRDVLFHDGTPLTPEIAAQALRNTAANARAERAYGFLSVKSVEVAGPDGVDLHLSEPNSFVLTDLSTISIRKPENPEIGTGPFKLVRRDPQRAVLAVFPQYYRGRPKLQGIDVVVYDTQRKAWAALMRGDVDMLYEVSREAADFVREESTVKTYTFDRPYYVAMVFNVRHPILRSVAVRKAINEALDRATLVHDGMNEQGRPADGPIWPGHFARPTATPQFPFDPADARRLLDDAGLKATRTAAGSMPSRFSFTCLVYAEDSRYERLAVIAQKELADIGIEMKLQPIKMKQIGAAIQEGNFDAFIIEFFGRSLSYTYEFWHHESGLINGGYVAADGALDRMRGAVSDEETKAAVADLTRVMHDDPPAAFIAWQATTRAVSTRFDVAGEQGRDILSSVWQWKAVTLP